MPTQSRVSVQNVQIQAQNNEVTVRIDNIINDRIRRTVGINLDSKITDEIISEFVSQAECQIYQFSNEEDNRLALIYYASHLLEQAGYIKDVASKGISDINESYSRNYQIRYLDEYKRLVRRKGRLFSIRTL